MIGILTEDDLFLKWTGSGYQAVNPKTSQWQSVTQVYADETKPYGDLYAVWQGFYYVFHSSDGTMEAIPMDYNTTRDDDGKVTAQTTKQANLVAKAEEKGTLYGGYFQDYGGAQDILVDDSLVGEAAMKSLINSEILQADGFWNYETNQIATGKDTSIDLNVYGAEDYTAEN
ncbi:MAG: hypothetical protein II017_04740, partial [Erysipelotrichaceae bacterium]|nr:hypothetical protein [Erysipelotrichaceae bacterium]